MSAITSVRPKVRRPGSGRTKGSFSFVKLTIADIKAKFADDTTPIIVSRKWAEQVGFTNVVSKPAGATVDAIEGTTPETKVQAKVHNFNDDE